MHNLWEKIRCLQFYADDFCPGFSVGAGWQYPTFLKAEEADWLLTKEDLPIATLRNGIEGSKLFPHVSITGDLGRVIIRHSISD